MSNIDKLLENVEIAEFLKANQTLSDEIKIAAENLAEKEEPERALKKVILTFINRKINVFFSYKKKDEETARVIVELLRKKSADKLKITYQYEFGDDVVGKKWRSKIHSEINNANWFILLLPDPGDDWDWCLYETGLFEAQATSADRLICLHHPDTNIPNPIEGYQAVAANEDEVEKFLRMVFIKDNPVYGWGPINKAIEDEIPEMAKEVVNAIRSPVTLVREVYEPWIELVVENPGKLENADELDKAIVKDANANALNLFRLLRKKITWGEFWQSLPTTNGHNGQWRQDLFRVIRKIGNDQQYYPVQAVFRNIEGKMYRPVVCAVDRDGRDGPIKVFHITFIEDMTSVDRSVMPKELSVLANTLRSTFRFRWEVLEKFSKEPFTEDKISCLQTALRRIRQDWESRNIGGEKEILELFPEEEQRNRITEMIQNWRKVQNDEKSGALDIAIRDQDLDRIPSILKRFLPMNQDFLEMAAERFTRLVTEYSV